MFWQLWHVVAVWGSRFWRVRVWLLYPGMRGVSHFLQVPRRMSVGRWVLVRWAMRFMSWMYLLAWAGSFLMVSRAWLYRILMRCWAILRVFRLIVGSAFGLLGSGRVYKTILR